MICANCNKDYNLNQKDGSSASHCKDCAESSDPLWNGIKATETKPEDVIIILLEKISGNIGIITILLVTQFLISLAFVIWVYT